MKEYFSYLAYLIGWKLISLLPESTAYRLFNKLARRMYQKNGKSVRRLRTNLSIVKADITPLDLELLVIAALESYLRYWCDTFRIHTWSPSRIKSSVSTNNEALLTEPMKAGRGVVVALPHSGNWDHAGAYFCQQGIPLVTVAEVLKPAKLFEKFLHYRERMGFEVLPLNAKAFPTLLEHAEQKRLIALVADRDLSASGIAVDFFGRESRMPAGPALLALKTGIPLISAHISYNDVGIHIDFQSVEVAQVGTEEERISETVANLARRFEEGIAAHPQDWHMLQRIWVENGLYT